jgi:hypothetical protein
MRLFARCSQGATNRCTCGRGIKSAGSYPTASSLDAFGTGYLHHLDHLPPARAPKLCKSLNILAPSHVLYLHPTLLQAGTSSRIPVPFNPIPEQPGEASIERLQSRRSEILEMMELLRSPFKPCSPPTYQSSPISLGGNCNQSALRRHPSSTWTTKAILDRRKPLHTAGYRCD